ncbi:M48 family metallopeptidase [Deinococcus arcticus]|nr:SprT family zinc-dependent metalloprotease [Deinococcus arcticus]
MECAALKAQPAAEWTLRIQEMEFTVRESARRKTLSLGVERDGQLLLLVPAGTSEAQLTAFVTSRLDWLYGKLAEKTALHRPSPQREYVSGEGFLFEGRSYRLHLVQAHSPTRPDALLTLNGQHFELPESQAAQGRELFVRWYTEQLTEWAGHQVQRLALRLRVQPKQVEVTDLGYRWGAASRTGTVSLHWRVALLPRRIAEYVLLHELVHLEFHHHKPEFWERLEVLLPDYAERKRWLARHGADHDL